MANAKTR